MGLLEKALSGAATRPPVPSQGGRTGGFFAKAAAAHLGLEEERPAPPKRAPAAAPLFGEADVARLSAALQGLPLKADYALQRYALIAKAVPSARVALFLPRGEDFALAASQGLPAPSGARLPSSVARGLLDASPAPDSAHRALLASALGKPSPDAIRCAALRSSPGDSLGALLAWLLPDPRSRSEDPALGALFSACDKAPFLRLVEASESPSSLIFRSIPPDRYAVAMLFQLDELFARAFAAIPGLTREAFASAAVSAASSLLHPHGLALWFERPRLSLALALFSSSPLDSELALFQFRKSFARSLSLFEDGEPPCGESFPVDPAEPGAIEALDRFFAG